MIRDVMGLADLTLWPQIGLGIFFLFFLAMSVRTMLSKGQDMEHNAHLPLRGDDSLGTKD